MQLLERKLADIAVAQERLELEIREAKYDELIREKITSIRQKEGEKDKIQSELSALNRQADSRAQLTIKRNELKSKQGQIEASCALLSLF
jgi:DNA repair protein RAD50